MKKIKILLLAVFAISANNAFADLSSLINSVREKVAGITPESLEASIADLKSKKDALVSKISALASMPGSEAVTGPLELARKTLEDQIDKAELQLAQLKPTPEALAKLTDKFNEITGLKDKATAQLDALKNAPEDMVTNLVKTAQTALIKGYNTALEALKPVIEAVKQKLASTVGLNAAAALGVK